MNELNPSNIRCVITQFSISKVKIKIDLTTIVFTNIISILGIIRRKYDERHSSEES